MARKKPVCNICGKPVKIDDDIDDDGIVDDCGQVWCVDCDGEFHRRVGELIDTMRKEKRNGTL